MECLKCGRETVGKKIFCDSCLKEMENSPVSPNTHVVIHHRPEPGRKAPAKKTAKPEEIIAKQNETLKRLQIALAVMSLLFATTAGILVYHLWSEYTDPDMGSNYSTVTYPDEGGNR